MLPIFNSNHLKNLYESFFGFEPELYGMNESEEYEFLIVQMIKVKKDDSIMKKWSNVKFMYFLYNFYNPK